MYMSDTMTHIFTFHGVTTQFEDYNLCVHVFTHTHTHTILIKLHLKTCCSNHTQ